MAARSLVDFLTAGPKLTRPRRARRRAARDRMMDYLPIWESMEDRTLLSTMLWNNPAGGDWDVPGNCR
jgi:hypothetical protein